MNLGGYADRVAHVNLNEQTISYEGIPEEWARRYIGARGLGVKYVFENGPSVDALGPDNIICFMNGPLTGTEASMSGRMAVVTKSPLTGTVTDSHVGGWTARAPALGWIRRRHLQRTCCRSGVRVCARRSGRATRCLRPLGHGHPRDHRRAEGTPRGGRPERHGDWPGRGARGSFCPVGSMKMIGRQGEAVPAASAVART